MPCVVRSLSGFAGLGYTPCFARPFYIEPLSLGYVDAIHLRTRSKEDKTLRVHVTAGKDMTGLDITREEKVQTKDGEALLQDMT